MVEAQVLSELKEQLEFYERQVNECCECLLQCELCPVGFSISHFSRKLNELRSRLIFYEGLLYGHPDVPSLAVEK